MEIKAGKTLIKIEYSFFILLSFAVLYGYEYSLNIIFFSILHEIGHLTALLALKIKPKFICLNFFGIGLKYQNNLSERKEFIVIFFGPLVNLILFLILKDDSNLILFLINSIPVLPLDGGRMLKIIAPKSSKVINYSALLLVISFAFWLLIKYKNFLLLLISCYLIFYNIRNKDSRG